MLEANQLGGTTPNRPPSIAALKKYNVNRVGQFEVIWQPLYNYQDYLVGGHNILTFFVNPVGVAAGQSSTTNMLAAGQLPRPQEFLVTGAEVTWENGAVIAQPASAVQSNWQDAKDVLNSGNFDFFVGSKSYLRDAPLGVFPQSYGLGGAGQQGALVGLDYARGIGRPYQITPVKLTANQNFNVTLNWPEGVVPVVTQSVIGVRLNGFLYRLSQ